MAGSFGKIELALGLCPNQTSVPAAIPPAIPVLLEHSHNFWGCVPRRRPETDTPLESLYRMYAAIVMGDRTELRHESNYFFNHAHKSWSVAALPDPQDPDLQRYAILSVIPELLCESFNCMIGIGVPRNRPGSIDGKEEAKYNAIPKRYETVPSWCGLVPALETELVLTYEGDINPVDQNDSRADQRFLKKNILIIEQTPFFA